MLMIDFLHLQYLYRCIHTVSANNLLSSTKEFDLAGTEPGCRRERVGAARPARSYAFFFQRNHANP